MITTINNENKTITVAFHIGRGGRFNNQGHKSFLPGVSSLQQCFKESSTVISEDENGVLLSDKQWKLIDGGGNTILEGRKDIEATTGILEWDTDYDTDIVRNIEDCTDDEMTILFKAYTMGEIDDVDAINFICEKVGYKHILDVNYDGNKVTVNLSDGNSITLDLDITGQEPEDVDSEEVKEWLMGEGADEPSAEYWSEQIETHYSY